jgi:hypothetical protein
MKNILKKFLVLTLFIGVACDLDGDLEDPNQISLSGADDNLIMNSLQLDFADFFSSSQSAVNPLVRMEAMTGGFRYQTANQPEAVNNLWTIAYSGVLINAEVLINSASQKNLTTHVAVAKILQAYTYLTLADIFGDVPMANALSGETGNFNPTTSTGAEVYTRAIELLTEARTELAKTGSEAGQGLTRDIFYGGNRTRWNALANTLELKAWLNLSLIPARKAEADTKIATFVNPTTGASVADLIDTPEEAFTYKYGTATVPDGSRHPLYDQYYDPVPGNAGGYIANYFLKEAFNGLEVEDPRWRYYFYRQVGSIARALEVDPKSLGCAPGAIPDHYAEVGAVFCVFDPGFYGRDHGDASGVPPDSPVITCAGVYPAGGRIDNTSTANANYAGTTVRGDGANGAGIEPVWMAFYTDYLKAEIVFRTGNTATARTLLTTAVQNSINQIRAFATSKSQTTTREPNNPAYIAAVEAAYDAAADKLDVIGREFYVACWGNGIEAYNNYRRTSAPVNLQPTIQLNPGVFFRSYVYPAVYVNLNSTAVQKDPTVTNKVFWDTNPDNLQ